jgi:DNA-binding CsgD family transcriptional regulator
MGHAIVLVSIVIPTIGFAVVFQGIQVYRAYRFPAVRAFVLYIALYNLVSLMTSVAQYLITNVSPLTSDGMYILVIVIMGSIGFTLAAFEIAFFASVVWHLSGMTRSPRWFIQAYGFVCTIELAAFIFGVYRFFHLADRRFLLDVHTDIALFLFAMDFLLPLLLLVQTRHIQPDRPRRMARLIGLFFISLSCWEIGSIFLPSQWIVFTAMLPAVVLNLTLLVWFRSFVRSYYGPLVPATESGSVLDRICAECHFSARERDIVEMILKGKSNKEIEQELFISPHTVKNHIYHIFQKAGVKSRGQLVSMILQNSAEVVQQRKA